MPIVYHLFKHDTHPWDSVWTADSLTRLEAVLQEDPLTELLTAHLPTQGTILEGGCGLGQYVQHLRHRGREVVGGDLSLTALRRHRRASADAPLVCLNLERTPVADRTFAAHISLGVVEHVHAGPQALLAEFQRTLAPGGVLLLATPWVNGVRRLFAPMLRRRQSARHRRGAVFHQYAFTRTELRAYLEEAGFHVDAFHPYSPAKGVREWIRLPWLRSRTRDHLRASSPSSSANPLSGLRQVLYWPPILWSFAHMVLVVARKPVG